MSWKIPSNALLILQEFLSALRAAGGFSQDICNFLYGYCAWESLFTPRMAKWREYSLQRYAKAEKSLLKVASDLDELNRNPYLTRHLTRQPWGELIQDATVALQQELGQPAVVTSEERDHTIGITPVNLTADLPRMLRTFADHLKQLRTAASVIMFSRRLGRNYELLELYLYLCCIKGIEPWHHLHSRDVQKEGPDKTVCGEVALLIGAAVDESKDPELVETNIENFRKMSPWLCKVAEQNFSEYRRYRVQAQEEHRPVTSYHEWIEGAQREQAQAGQ